MNQQEMNALKQAELDPMAGMLYVRGFRYYMNYATGEVSLSLSRLAQELEYHPPLRSSRKVERPSTKRVRTLIQNLVDSGLIALKKSGDAMKNEAAVYVCVMATTDKKRREKAPLKQVRPNPQGHELDTGQGHVDGHSLNRVDKGVQAEQGHIGEHRENSRQGHISERSEIYKREIARDPNFEQPCGRDLTLTQPLMAIAFRRYGQNQHLIENEFESFRLHKSHRTTQRSLLEWQDEWKRWIARSNIMNPTSTQRGNHHAQRQHPAAAILDVCERYASGQPGTEHDDTDD
ncbi:hypothetical protein [Aliidiomarina maris]|uniref:Uncharacterized protein n=1 Tax=Aliidiomarina maris TaxID=531312 RepID=A0A327X417_9GAMM|nr:hypothetical protein [Aliidiomarina maris]RAK01625.1 hypothetical protein B0I24_101248 [Aliidiomarina maris]RUO28450.1 hypothetical protein CWE07_01185 [Aliidiomarina maris]